MNKYKIVVESLVGKRVSLLAKHLSISGTLQFNEAEDYTCYFIAFTGKNCESVGVSFRLEDVKSVVGSMVEL